MCRGQDRAPPLLPSPSLPTPPLLFLRSRAPYIQLGGLGERCKLPQRVRAEPGRQTILGAFWAKTRLTSPSGDSKVWRVFSWNKMLISDCLEINVPKIRKLNWLAILSLYWSAFDRFEAWKLYIALFFVLPGDCIAASHGSSSCSFSPGDSDLRVFVSKSRWREWFVFFACKRQWTVISDLCPYPVELTCYSYYSYHIVCVRSAWNQQLGVCVLPEVKLPQRIYSNSNVPFAYYRSNRAFADFASIL